MNNLNHVIAIIFNCTPCICTGLYTSFDNGGFSGVVTLNSLGGVLPRWFFPFVNKLPVSNLFSTTFNLIGDLFMLPYLLHVIKSN